MSAHFNSYIMGCEMGLSSKPSHDVTAHQVLLFHSVVSDTRKIEAAQTHLKFHCRNGQSTILSILAKNQLLQCATKGPYLGLKWGLIHKGGLQKNHFRGNFVSGKMFSASIHLRMKLVRIWTIFFPDFLNFLNSHFVSIIRSQIVFDINY